MSFKIEKLTESGILGESPFWDERTQQVYYVDIKLSTIHCYNPSTKFYAKATIGTEAVTFIIPIENKPDYYVIGYGNKVVKIKWDGKSEKVAEMETIYEIENPNPSGATMRFNDGKADPSGRLWAGVNVPKVGPGFEAGQGSLLAFTVDGIKKLESGVTLSNGLAWDIRKKKFYYIDTTAKEVYQYDYDDANCSISNRKVLLRFDDAGLSGSPDGMTIDGDGNLYVAAIGGGKIYKLNPNNPGKVDGDISFPTTIQVTCGEFAGPNYEDLYVTTARIPFGGDAAPEGPDHGATLRVTGLGVRGVPARKVKL